MHTPVMKPTMTLFETNFVIQPSFSAPRASWMTPTSSVRTISIANRSLLSLLPRASPTARETAPVVVTVMNTDPAKSAPIGVPSTRVLRPLTGLTVARIAEAMASGIWTNPFVRPAARSPRRSLALGRPIGNLIVGRLRAAV